MSYEAIEKYVAANWLYPDPETGERTDPLTVVSILEVGKDVSAESWAKRFDSQPKNGDYVVRDEQIAVLLRIIDGAVVVVE